MFSRSAVVGNRSSAPVQQDWRWKVLNRHRAPWRTDAGDHEKDQDVHGAGGSCLENIVKMNIFLKDINDLPAV